MYLQNTLMLRVLFMPGQQTLPGINLLLAALLARLFSVMVDQAGQSVCE
jgi:hypothetical protein